MKNSCQWVGNWERRILNQMCCNQKSNTETYSYTAVIPETYSVLKKYNPLRDMQNIQSKEKKTTNKQTERHFLQLINPSMQCYGL